MRYAGVGMKSFLASKQFFWQADLFTFTLRDTSVYRWTTTDAPITAGGFVWFAIGPILTRTGWSMKNTMQVPTMTLKLNSDGQDFQTVGGSFVNIKHAMHNGLLDNAKVLLQRAIMPTFGDTSLGLVDLFSASVSGITINALGADITLKGGSSILQQYMPRNLYQLGCVHALYDTGCTLLRTTFQSSNTVSASELTSVGLTTAVDPALYERGTVLFTSGPATGSKRTVVSATANSLSFAYPLYDAPSVGDTVVLTRGCARTRAACGTFGNIQHFRGFPYIPPVETAF